MYASTPFGIVFSENTSAKDKGNIGKVNEFFLNYEYIVNVHCPSGNIKIRSHCLSDSNDAKTTIARQQKYVKVPNNKHFAHAPRTNGPIPKVAGHAKIAPDKLSIANTVTGSNHCHRSIGIHLRRLEKIRPATDCTLVRKSWIFVTM